MKKCLYCGRENDLGADRCVECCTRFESDDGSPVDGSYEFTEDQDRVISNVASSMRIVALVLMVVGSFQMVIALVGFMGSGDANLTRWALQGGLALVIGGFTMQAGTAFRKIVSAKGNDIGHLMEALSVLRKLYRLQVVLFVIAAVLLGAAFVVVLNGNG